MIIRTQNSDAEKPHGMFHNLFDIVVVLKGLNGLVEIASGATLLSIKAGTILEWVLWLTESEMLQDPHDYLASSLQKWALNFGHDAQVFAGLYLVTHGVIKLVLAILLYKERPWVFPLSLLLFTALVAFSLHHLLNHWSWPLTFFIAFDAFTIGVIAREWSSVGKVTSRHV